METRPLTFLVAVCTVAIPSLSAQSVTPAFEEVTEPLGASFSHTQTAATGDMGAGMAWLDVDGDRDDDLLLCSSDGQHRLLRWDLAAGRFTDISAGSGLAPAGPGAAHAMGLAVADYDDDGLPDVYITRFGKNRLLHNEGGGVFTDVGEALGVEGEENSTSASWADFDRDGDLDIYVGNFVKVFNFPFKEGWPNRLYVNEGTPEEPVFVDRALELGVDDWGFTPEPPPPWVNPKVGEPVHSTTLSVSTLDYDDDGDADLLVGNDFGAFAVPNRIYRNDTAPGGPLVFTDVSSATQGGITQFNMGVHGADFDRDGDWDLYCSNLGDNALLEQVDGAFIEGAAVAGPVEGTDPTGEALRSSWDTIWMDYDNDGWEDLYVVNGFVGGGFVNETQAPNSLWHNEGDGTFTQVLAGGMANKRTGRSSKFTDLDGDGGLEVYLVNNALIYFGWPPDFWFAFGAKSRLYRARPPAGRHWIQFRLQGTRSNVEALGARLEVTALGRTQKRQVRSDGIFLSTPSRLQHVGLGDAERVDQLVVRWPSGTHQELHDLDVDQRLHLVEPDVVHEGAPHAVPAARGLQLVAPLVNLTPTPQHVRVDLSLHDQDGVVVFEGSRTLTLAGGASVPARIEAPAPAGALGRHDLAAAVTTLATGARDERVVDL